MSWTDLSTWKLVDRRERKYELHAGHNKPKFDKGSALALRSTIKPVDFYTYLIGRFGEPNGMQSLLLRHPSTGFPGHDSGNIIHWDFDIVSGDVAILVTGLTREIHVFVSNPVSDAEWKTFIDNLRRDFGVHSKAKSVAQKRLEKWTVFANPFVAIADTCADLHDKITQELTSEFRFDAMGESGLMDASYQEQLKAVGERANRIYGDCLSLRMLTPVLGEAFINMLTALLAKPELKDDQQTWLAYRRSTFHSKIENLSEDCMGFSHPLDKNADAYKSFMRIRSKRNDVLHANVLPEQDSIETVYFDGKTPLPADAGDVFQAFWKQHEAWVDPKGAIKDYEDVHLFCIEVESLLQAEIRAEFRTILDEKFPGYDVSRRRFGKLFPDHIAHFTTDPNSIRYDDQINQVD